MKKNFIYNMVYQILGLILPLITMPYVSRILGVNGIGIYSYTYSIAYYFMIIAMLGLNNYGNRTIAKVRDNKEKLSKEFWSIYLLQLIISITMVLCYLFYIKMFCNQYIKIAIIQVMYVISSMFDINWFFFGIEKFKLTITRNTLIKVLSLALIFLLVKSPDDIWKYTAILSGSRLFSYMLLFPFLKKYVKLTKVSKNDIIKHFKPNLILFLPVVAVSIYKIMDKIMLGILSTVTEVGYYENAEKITSVPITITNALGTVMLPLISNMISNNNEDKAKKLIKKTMPFVMFLAFPMTVGIIAVSRDFSIAYFGKEFEKSGYLMQLLAITLIFQSWGNAIRTQYLIPKEKDKEYVISEFLGAIVNLIMNFIFIPKYDAVGACIGTILAEFMVAFYQSFIIRKELEIITYIKNSIVFFVKSLMMFIIIYIIGYYIDNRILRILIQTSLGSILYFLMNFKYIYNDLKLKSILSRKIKIFE